MNFERIIRYCLPVLIVVMSLLMTGCTSPTSQESTGVIELRDKGLQMPAFSLPSPLSDQSITTSESLKGKVVLVTFFASWCRSCLKEIPLLKKMQTRFGDQGFALIAMAIDHENEVGLKNLIQKQKINYQILLADDAVKRDFGGIALLPTMFLIDRDGKLLKKYSGHIEREFLV